MERNEMPLGFTFALAQDPKAMKAFSELPQDKQDEILQRAHGMTSKEGMQALVDSLTAES